MAVVLIMLRSFLVIKLEVVIVCGGVEVFMTTENRIPFHFSFHFSFGRS